MHNTRIFWSCLLFIICLSACTEDQPLIDPDRYLPERDCPYKMLVELVDSVHTMDGSEREYELKAILKANLEAFAVELGGSDRYRKYENLVSEHHRLRIDYSDGYPDTHNALISILCAEYERLQDSTLSADHRGRILDRIDQTVQQYIDKLLEREVSEEQPVYLPDAPPHGKRPSHRLRPESSPSAKAGWITLSGNHKDAAKYTIWTLIEGKRIDGKTDSLDNIFLRVPKVGTEITVYFSDGEETFSDNYRLSPDTKLSIP
ncbi:MAG: hypothetical protein AAF990_00740 [Bacteroidota bacterium]